MQEHHAAKLIICNQSIQFKRTTYKLYCCCKYAMTMSVGFVLQEMSITPIQVVLTHFGNKVGRLCMWESTWHRFGLYWRFNELTLFDVKSTHTWCGGRAICMSRPPFRIILTELTRFDVKRKQQHTHMWWAVWVIKTVHRDFFLIIQAYSKRTYTLWCSEKEHAYMWWAVVCLSRPCHENHRLESSWQNAAELTGCRRVKQKHMWRAVWTWEDHATTTALFRIIDSTYDLLSKW